MNKFIFSIDNKGNEDLITVIEDSIWAARTAVAKLMTPGSTIIGYTVIGSPQQQEQDNG